MYKILFLVVTGFLLAFSAITQAAPQKYVAEEILVQPRKGLPMKHFDKILSQHGGKRIKLIKKIGVYSVKIPPNSNPIEVVEELKKNKHIKSAEVDRQFEPTFFPNDPYFNSGWHLLKIEATTAWDLTLGNDVIIAILDSGVYAEHPDLVEKIVPGWNAYDNNADTSDVYGHGTAVAGSAAATTNNGIGVASVGYNAKIMPVRITDERGFGYSSAIAEGLIFAADNGARVANISFLGISYSTTILAAAQYMRSKGGVVVVAGGNTNLLRNEFDSPDLTTVSATDQTDTKASFASWGDYIDITAPGVSILTTTRAGEYTGFNGTSASTPVVAGVYALIISANASLVPTQIDSILFSTAVDLGDPGEDQYFGAGRVNAYAAVVEAMSSTPPDVSAPNVQITNPIPDSRVSGLITVDVSATDDRGVTRVDFYAGGNLVATDSDTPYAFSLDTEQYIDGNLELEARAYDAANNSSFSKVNVIVANDTTKPTVQILTPQNGDTVSGVTLISVAAADNQKVQRISLRIDGQEVAQSFGSTLNYNWNVPESKGKGPVKNTNSSKGGPKQKTSTITAEAFDPAGNNAVTSITVYR